MSGRRRVGCAVRSLPDVVRAELAGRVDADRMMSEAGVALEEVLEASAIIASAMIADDPAATDADFCRLARAAGNGLLLGLRARQMLRTVPPAGRLEPSAG
jgi:hypothetical protein